MQRAMIETDLDTAEIKSWIAWAVRVATEMDPLAHGLDKLLAKHQQAAEEAGKPEAAYPHRYG